MSNYNPYAYTSPQQPPGMQPITPAAGQPQPWEIGEVISHAWAMFKPAWPTLVFTQFLGGLIGGIPNYVPGGLVAGHAVEPNSSEYWTIYGICALIGLIINTFFTGGLMKIWLATARGQTPQFSDMFAGAGRFLPLLGALFLTMFAVGIASAFFLIPGIILALGLTFAQLFVVDQKMGPIDAMKASWEVTKGHKGKIFLFGLVALLLIIAGYLACCIGVFVAMPLAMVAWTTIYTRITGTMGAPQPPPGGMYGGGYGPPGGGFGPPGSPPGYGPPPAGGFGGPPGYGPPGGGYGGPPPV